MKYQDFCVPWELLNHPNQTNSRKSWEEQALLHYINMNLPEIVVEDIGGWKLYFGFNTRTKYYFDDEIQCYRGRQYILEEEKI